MSKFERDPSGISHQRIDPLKSPKRERPKQDLADLVRIAREKGFIDKLPPGMQKVLEQRYPQEGEPKALSDIGADMKITKGSVRQKEAKALRRIKRLLEGKRQTDVGRPRDDIDVNEATRLYTLEEKTEREIANLIDCNQSTISDRLRVAGVPTRSKGRRRMEININLLAWQYFAQEMSARKVAEPLGISYTTVLNRLKEAEYQIRSVRRPRKK